jgi:hypothetical protein
MPGMLCAGLAKGNTVVTIRFHWEVTISDLSTPLRTDCSALLVRNG